MTRPLDVARWSPWLRDRYAAPAPASPERPVTFPTTLLATKVEIALGADLTQPWWLWQWADITQWVRHEQGITVKDGRKDEHGLVEAGVGEMTLDNRDGRFSRRNPTSPYYPLLSKNTPIRASLDPGSGFSTRMEMFVNSWPNRSDRSGNDVTMPISCAGILRRLGQGSVLKSPLRRSIPAHSPLVYWPMEDGDDAAQSASGVLGAPLTIAFGAPAFGGIGPAGSSAAVDFSLGGTLVGQISGASAESWTVAWAASTDETDDASFLSISLDAGGTYVAFAPHPQGPMFGAGVNALSAAGGLSGPVSAARTSDLEEAAWHWWAFTAAQNGGNIDLELFVDGVSIDTGSVAGTLTAPRSVTLNAGVLPTSDLPGSICHLVVYSGAAATDHTSAMTGFAGEQAAVRMARLCAEEGVPFHFVGSQTTTMGPQSIDTFLKNLRECESADLGVLYEYSFGLGYQSRAERYNAPVLLNLDFAQGHIWRPPANEDDDQQLRNRWTVKRKGGSEATVEDTESIAANGVWADSAEVNLERDAQCKHAAGWRRHIPAEGEERWPSLSLNFASVPGRELIDEWLALPFGARVQVANPPDTYSPDPVDAFIEGRDERWDLVSWDTVFNTSPAQPFEVHTVEGSGNRGRVGSSTSTLAADVASDATSLSVGFTGVRWVDSGGFASSFPFDLDVGGERITVTAIAGTSSPQTFTVTRSVNGVVKAHTAGTRVGLWKPGVIAF